MNWSSVMVRIWLPFLMVALLLLSGTVFRLSREYRFKSAGEADQN